jgi:ribonuclease VapC
LIAIDTSALIAIVLKEPEQDSFSRLIQTHGQVLIGSPTLFEFRMVALGKFQPIVAEGVTAFVRRPPFEVVDFTSDHFEAALRAFDRYGKGRHPASLNFGDCMAYAVAAVAGCALLYKGNDFERTDVKRLA